MTERKWEPDLYKKWFRTRTTAGFLALRPWFAAGKVSVDIGELGDGGLKSNTMVWAPALGLAVYLRKLITVGTTEAYLYYGGGKTDDGLVSRILKIDFWNDTKPSDGYRWKTGIFAATESDTGAFVPDMAKPKSTNFIKVTSDETAEISYMLDLALTAHAVRSDNWMAEILGKDRERGE